jgi:UDP:flavonoid glycosyltransferase YjiC (YdhE family)
MFNIIVSSGGSGTIYPAIQNKVPLIIIPIYGDQEDNGHWIEKYKFGVMIYHTDSL